MRNASPRFSLPFKGAAALAVLSGLLYFLAFPGIDLWPLAFVALVPLILALRGQKPKHALLFGWLSGFTMTMLGFYWLLEMLQTFSGFPLPLCALFMALLSAYQAGRIALLGWVYARVEARGWPAAPAFLLVFAASEQIYPLLFPWSYAATVHQLPALIQLAEIGGPILVALPLVAANLAVAELILARLEQRDVRWKSTAALALAPIVAAVYGAIRIGQVDELVRQAKPAEVGLVQANMSLLGKRKDRQEGLRRHLKLTKKLEKQKPEKLDLVVWSETSVMASIDEAAKDTEVPRRVTNDLDIPAIFGIVLRRPVNDVRRHVYLNSALATDRRGRVVGQYNKQFLLAFGEYLPLGETFPILYEWSPNSGRFTPGTSHLPLQIGQRQIATFICYEDIIPGFVNTIVNAGHPDLLVNLTNDAWFGDTTEPWIHLALSKFRAVEHRRFFVRSTNSGVSAFVDPVGRVISHTKTFKEQAIRERIAWMRSTTPYEVIGDVPWWLAVLAAGALAWYRRGGISGRSIPPPAEPAPKPTSAPSPPPVDFKVKSRDWFARPGTARGPVE
jgi:apolipoprotein N-acyltransferase